jgi:4-hydroxy-tetrahydrodipicolinate synthase
VDKAAGLPIMLYSYPGRSGTDFGEDFLKEASAHTNFQSIKESSGDLERVHLLATSFPGLQLSCGADDQALEFFAWGATSWVCAGANFMASECRALYEACVLRGDFETGRRIMAALLPLMTVLERGGKFVQCVKHACSAEGLPVGNTVRQPLQPVDEELAVRMDQAVHLVRNEIAALHFPES